MLLDKLFDATFYVMPSKPSWNFSVSCIAFAFESLPNSKWTSWIIIRWLCLEEIITLILYLIHQITLVHQIAIKHTKRFTDMFFFIPEIYDEQEVLRKYFSNAAKLIWFAIFFFFYLPGRDFNYNAFTFTSKTLSYNLWNQKLIQNNKTWGKTLFPRALL